MARAPDRDTTRTENRPTRADHLLVRAVRGEAVERPPVWAMRQAGRWDPEFVRLRTGKSFYEFSENVELAARASLLPRRFSVDAIILFYDITTLAVAMGLPFTLEPARGPVPERPVRTLADVDRLQAEPDPESFRHVRDLLRTVRRELDVAPGAQPSPLAPRPSSALPVIVFAGAPFTLATYCIGTGKDVSGTRSFIGEQPQVWDRLLDRLAQATIHFLRTLVGEGADVYQLFDSWAGLLEKDEYARWAQPYHQAIFAAVHEVPRILFVKEGPYLEPMAQCGADVVSLGARHDLAAARRSYPGLVFQGNVDSKLLRSGTASEVVAATRRCLAEGEGRRHIVNLNHGVDPGTPVANFEAFVRAARGETS